MRYATTVGVDLAKNVIRISVVSGRGKELCNRSLTRKKFAEAARWPNTKEAPIKSVEQQGLQAILRARDRLIQVWIAQSNHMLGILLGFGIAIPLGSGAAFAKGRGASACVGLTPRQYNVSDKAICSGDTFTALRPSSPLMSRGTEVRIHRGPGDSVSARRPNLQTRLNSDRNICLLDWRSPYTKRSFSCTVPWRIDESLQHV